MNNSLLREKVIDKFKDGDKIVLRPSSIQQFLRCPYQYAQAQLLGNYIKPAAAARAGNALHEAFEEGYNYKLITGEMPKKDMILNKAEVSWSQLNEEEEIQYKKDETYSKYESDILDGVGTYYDEIMPTITPYKVEERFTIKLGHPQFSAVSGTADLIAKGGLLNSSMDLIDYKFTKRATNASHYLLQQNAYTWLARENGIDITSSVLHNVIRPTTRSGVRLGILDIDYKEKYLKLIINKILNSTTEFIENGTGAFTTGSDPVTNYLCGSAWCGYYNDCPHVEGLRIEKKEIRV